MIINWKKYYDFKTKTLLIPHDFNKDLTNLPLGVQIIIFQQKPESRHSSFNKQVYGLPYSLIKIEFGSSFDKCVNNLPNSITHLNFGSNFNQPIEKYPDSLTHLVFGIKFDRKLCNLPIGLTHLTLGSLFDRPVNKLPKGLKYLKFGSCFNQTVDKLPNGLTHLQFGNLFNSSLSKLPNSITHLKLGNMFKKYISHYPSSLIDLCVEETFTGEIPSTVKSLGIKTNCELINNIPEHIKILNIYFLPDQNIEKDVHVSNIPSSVEKIRINYAHKINLITKIPFGCIITDFNDIILKL